MYHKIVQKNNAVTIILKTMCQNPWENKFETGNFDWNKIWKASVYNVKEPRLKTLNWKIMSNLYPTKVFLKTKETRK